MFLLKYFKLLSKCHQCYREGKSGSWLCHTQPNVLVPLVAVGEGLVEKVNIHFIFALVLQEWTAIHLWILWPWVHPEGQSECAFADAYRGETIPMSFVWEDFQDPRWVPRGSWGAQLRSCVPNEGSHGSRVDRLISRYYSKAILVLVLQAG